MAQQLTASIYRINEYDLKVAAGIPAVQGVLNTFPTQGIRMFPVTGTVTANNVAMSTVIALLPPGLNQPEKLFYSPTALATLATAANA